jgi:hypothetical protein
MPNPCVTMPTMSRRVRSRVEYATTLLCDQSHHPHTCELSPHLFCSVPMTVTVVLRTSPMRK